MFALWLLLPISILFSTVAMATGIGGALFFSPLFLLAYGLGPAEAFTLGIIIELFGFLSGLSAYARERLILYPLANKMLTVAVPLTFLGVLLSFTAGPVLEMLFACFLFLLGFGMLYRQHQTLLKHPDFHDECHEWRAGRINYHVPNQFGRFFGLTAVGGLLVGLFSSGIGETNEYLFLRRMEMHPALASGTSVFIVAMAALTSVILRLTVLGTGTGFADLVPYALVAIPGVLIGGQLGMRAAERVKDPGRMRRYVGMLFLLIGVALFLIPHG